MAFYRLEPLGEYRADLHAALMAMVMANIWRNPKKRRRTFGLRDFLLRFRVSDSEQDWQDQLEIVTQLNAVFGGMDLRDSPPPQPSPERGGG